MSLWTTGTNGRLQEITSPSLPEFAEFSHLSCGAADHGRPLGVALRGEKLIRRRFYRGSDQLSRAGDMNKGIAHLHWMAEFGMKLGKILRLQRVTLYLLHFRCCFHVKTSHLEAMFGDLSHSSLRKLVNFLSFTICQNMKHWPPLTIETCNPSKKRIIGHTVTHPNFFRTRVFNWAQKNITVLKKLGSINFNGLNGFWRVGGQVLRWIQKKTIPRKSKGGLGNLSFHHFQFYSVCSKTGFK